ncbi:S26 family signal peptidase [Tundrisphaera sp. TA3]|uniref:S26 family signal peptidase n=1 Tax=Tundrisphaera sp. TA3 TaxID=3435775 RepID=UPI003EBE5845
MSRTPTIPAPQPKMAQTPPPPSKPKESWRDLIEQFVVAIVLAMLVRGFDAEAFVIPTGSMAPTLMGRHKEINCPQCVFLYAINASDESEAMVRRGRLEEVGICPNCRYTARVTDTPSYKGDRILVMKFPYDLPFLPGSSGPSRWDVVVFHYPVNPETNYIKRMVGLPGEDLRLNRGDIQTRPGGTADAFRIQRKPLHHQRAMQMTVYDDAHRAAKLRDLHEWDRWKGAEGWKEETPGRYVASDPAGVEWSRLAYRHLIPDPEQWAAIEAGEKLPRAPRPSLITDFYGYNSNVGQNPYDNWLQSNWVGDLTVSGRVDVTKAVGHVRFELVEGGVTNRCEFDLATGKATLYHGEAKLGEATTALVGLGGHDVEFANVDDRLTLWVDGQTPFGDGLVYEESPDMTLAPDASDLTPAGVSIRDGAAVAVSGLVVKRDIYYTLDPRFPDVKIPVGLGATSETSRVIAMFDFLSDPAQFAAFGELPPGDPYAIRPDHFMMMGDNSPRSWDSRAWNSDDRAWRTVERSSWEVPRSMLIGKAFFVYWPHGKPFGPDIRLNRDLQVPFRPYVERMKWIR